MSYINKFPLHRIFFISRAQRVLLSFDILSQPFTRCALNWQYSFFFFDLLVCFEWSIDWSIGGLNMVRGKKHTVRVDKIKTRRVKFMLWNELRSMTSLQSNSSQALKPWNVQKKRQSKRLGLILWPFIVVIIRYHYYFTIIINFSFALLPLFRMHIFIDWVECGRANSIALNIS